MSAPLDDIASYSTFVYALSDRHSFVTQSTLSLAPIGATLAKLEGRVECQGTISSNACPSHGASARQADFVIECYVDPTEPLREEGLFGEHTGYNTLPEQYPVFHVIVGAVLRACCAVGHELFLHHENFDRARGQPKPGPLVATRDGRRANRHPRWSVCSPVAAAARAAEAARI